MLSKVCAALLEQLGAVVSQLQEEEFSRPSVTLSNASVGQHVRHTLEFFVCLREGMAMGTVCYDRRAHNKLIESNKLAALSLIHEIEEFVLSINENQSFWLEVEYDKAPSFRMETNFHRELNYNMEHAIHHMALMKIGIREIAPHLAIPTDFGVASSTIRYRENTYVQAEQA